MIVLDENVHDAEIREPIERWYPGQVISVRRLRPQSTIKDEALPTLLRRANEPTFVTINVNDFWLKSSASASYYIIALELSQDDALEIPELLRHVLRLAPFKSKSSRMGKVVHWTPTSIEYYESDRRIIRVE